MKKTVGIIGGDKRFLFTAEAFLKSGYEVYLFGFSKLFSSGDLQLEDDFGKLELCDIALLPLPPFKEANKINAPFAKEDLLMDETLIPMLSKKKIFCGMKEKLFSVCGEWKEAEVYDYFAREDFTLLNAYLTAEGALQTALNSFEGSVLGSKILVCGFGRIGKCLTKILRDMKADVFVSARKAEDFAKITMNGYCPLNTSRLKEVRGFDIVFNTVPSLIFNEKLLENTDKNTLIIDLASKPGGVDKAAAQSLDIDVIHALGLPGKTAPKSAGEIIKNTIVNMLEEDVR